MRLKMVELRAEAESKEKQAKEFEKQCKKLMLEESKPHIGNMGCELPRYGDLEFASVEVKFKPSRELRALFRQWRDANNHLSPREDAVRESLRKQMNCCTARVDALLSNPATKSAISNLMAVLTGEKAKEIQLES